jgi:hypothetical protein
MGQQKSPAIVGMIGRAESKNYMSTNKITPFSQQDQSDYSESLAVSIMNMRPNPKPGGSVLAYADVRVGPLTICGVSVVKNKSGGEFVALPARAGGRQWFDIVKVDEPLKGRIINSVMEAWRGSHV